MRAYLSDIDGSPVSQTISSDKPVIIKGMLVKTDGMNNATLEIIDADGSVTPPGGLVVYGEHGYGGMTNVDETASPSIIATLTGSGSSAVIYYEEIPWKELAR